MSDTLTYVPTRTPIVAQKPSSDDPLTILRTFAGSTTPMGAAGLSAALRGERPMVVLERCARIDGVRLGAVSS